MLVVRKKIQNFLNFILFQKSFSAFALISGLMGAHLISQTSFAKAPLCSSVFASIETKAIESFRATRVSQKTSKAFIDSAAGELESTTGNRVERKFTVNQQNVEFSLNKLESRLQKTMPDFVLKSRDAQTPGFKNVTLTRYLTKLKIFYKDQQLTTKIRIRKYGLIEENSAVDKSKVRISDLMKDSDGRDFSWLEFKIEHPDFEKAVLKPRIQFHDQFTDLMANSPRDFLEKFDHIVEMTLDLNPDKVQTVKDMLRAIKLTLKEGVSLKTISETLYFRTSYVVNLQSQKDQRVNIQLTVDADIHQYSSVLGKEVQTYDPDSSLSVIEIKIPVIYAGLTKINLNEVPGLVDIKTMIQELSDNQSKDYEIDKGKFSRAVRVLLQEKERGQNDL